MFGIRYPLTALVCLLAPVAIAQAQEQPAASTEQPASPKKEGRLLFDGKSLKNWKITDFGGQGDVEVKGGQLVMHMGQPLTGVTWDGPELPRVNYELTLQAQRAQGSDFFCCLTFPVKESHCSLVLGGWGGGVTGLSCIDDFDASDNETTDYRAFEKGKWYPVKVQVTDSTIAAWLEDDQIVNVDYSDKKISLRIEVEICKPLGVCTFQTQGALRNFRLRELSPEEVAQIKAQQKAN